MSLKKKEDDGWANFFGECIIGGIIVGGYVLYECLKPEETEYERKEREYWSSDEAHKVYHTFRNW